MELSRLYDLSDALSDCESLLDLEEQEAEPPAYLLKSYRPDFCGHGHEYTPENTVYHQDGALRKKRVCRTCQRESDARRVTKPDMKPAHLEEIGGRRDSLPEYAHYRDTGCSWAPLCLECPFEQCRFEAPEAQKHARVLSGIEQFVALREMGLSVQACADTMGVSRRTCFRYSAEAYKDKPRPKPVKVTRVLTNDSPTTATRDTEAIRAAVEDARRALRVLEALRA